MENHLAEIVCFWVKRYDKPAFLILLYRLLNVLFSLNEYFKQLSFFRGAILSKG